MIEYRPFREGHLAYLKPQKVQAGEYQALVASGAASALEGGGSRFLVQAHPRSDRRTGASPGSLE